jgi:hypothetical protein
MSATYPAAAPAMPAVGRFAVREISVGTHGNLARLCEVIDKALNMTSSVMIDDADSPQRIEQDAAQHYATLVDAFGPPYPPLDFNDPMEKGPLVQLLEDCLTQSALTPQTTLREQAPAPPGAN